MENGGNIVAFPAYLQSAAEYRARLLAELAKVDEFLRTAHAPNAKPGADADFDPLLLGSFEEPERMWASG